jgi:hypothetical protein
MRVFPVPNGVRHCDVRSKGKAPSAERENSLPRSISGSPLGQESTKARDEKVGWWELEDQRQLVRIAWVKWKEAAANRGTSGRLRHRKYEVWAKYKV